MGIPDFVDFTALAPGMHLISEDAGSCTLVLMDRGRASKMRFLPVTAHLDASTVDFYVERCPSISGPVAPPAGGSDDVWFTVNYCLEGRCEVVVPAGGFVVVEPGDVCVSYSDRLPEEFSYPLGRYRGVELFVSSAVTGDPEFKVLQEAGLDLAAWARRVNAAAIFSHDEELERILTEMGVAVTGGDRPRIKVSFMDLMLRLTERDIDGARPRSFLTKGQMSIARTVRDELEADLAAVHDTREIARRMGVGVTALNSYFCRVYGMTIPAYLRQRRMERAAELLLAERANVADVALAAGYSNPSKFSAAFKRIYGETPSEWRRLHSA